MTRTTLKFVACVSFIFVILNLIFIHKTPASGYELSIYSSTPFIVWVFLIGSFCGGFYIMVSQAFDKNERSKFWVIGLLLIIINNFLVLSLHGLRDYYLYSGSDHITHLNYASQIKSTGVLDHSNFYPIVHIYVAEFSSILNVQLIDIGIYLPPIFSILYMIWIYALAKKCLHDRGGILLATASSSILFFNSLHIQTYPHSLSVLFMPIILIFYLKYENIRYRLLFIIIAVLYQFFYPLSSIMILMFIISAEFTKLVFRGGIKNIFNNLNKISMGPILIMVVTFITWIASFALFGSQIRNIISATKEPMANQHIQQATQALYNIKGIEFIELFFKMYGDSLVLILLAIFAIIIIISQHKNIREELLLITVIFSISLPLQIVFFIGTKTQTLGRLLNLNYMMIAAAPLVGFALYYIAKNRRMNVLFITLIFVLLASIGIFGVYQSPWIFQPSWQVTKMDTMGVEWADIHRNTEMPFSSMGIPPSLKKPGGFISPEHFNYTSHRKLSDSFIEETYLYITERSKLANNNLITSKYRMIQSIQWGFDTSDFYRLNNDSSVHNIYVNGEFDTYLID